MATARVQIVLDVDVRSSWGDDCQVGQIFKQAAEEAMNHVNRVIQEKHLRATIVGEPVVTAVMHQQEKRR